jgi:NTE family protein
MVWEQIAHQATRRRADLGRMGVRRPGAEGSQGARTAFVLSGGGNQGVSQVGMLRAVLERGIVPDVVIGTSAGALNGASVAYAPSLAGLEQLEAVWLSLTTADVFPGNRLSRAWNVVRRETHLFEATGLDALVDRATPARSFADLSVPLRVIATDLDSGEEVVIARGPLKPALLASAALPGVFPIVEHDRRRLVDGGVVNSVPLWHALSGPVDRIIVFNVSAGAADRDERSALDVVMTSFMHSRSQRFELEMRNAPREVDIVVLPRPADRRELFDFSAARSSSTRRTVSRPESSTAPRPRPAPTKPSGAVPTGGAAAATPSPESGQPPPARSWVASRANSRTTLGRMPRNRTPAAAIASAVDAPASTRGRRVGSGSAPSASVRGAYIASTMRK